MTGRSQFYAYRQGWKYGAQSLDPKTAPELKFSNQAIGEAYRLGVRDGQLALTETLRRAAERYGYNHTDYMRDEM